MTDFLSLYESNCEAMKESIITALVEICRMTKDGIYVLDKENVIRLSKSCVVGAGIVNNYICLIISKNGILNKRSEYVVISENQNNPSFMEFNSNFSNWVKLIHFIQKEAKLLEDENSGEPTSDTDEGNTDETPIS